MTELNEQTIFEILAHPTRRKILRMLFQVGYMNYSDFKEEIGQSPGVIYHHLEKLREIGILQQKSTKEYELTALGLNIVSYLDKMYDEDSFLRKNPIQNFFFIIPLTQIIKNYPSHWIIEALLIFILTSLIQITFPIQIIGPFLFPSTESFLIRAFYQILSYIIMFLLINVTLKSLSSSSTNFLNTMMLRGFLIFPLLSSSFSFLLWGLSLLFIAIPGLFYWVLTILLHGCYIYFIIHLLMKIYKISFEHSIIISLIQNYSFLIMLFLLS